LVVIGFGVFEGEFVFFFCDGDFAVGVLVTPSFFAESAL
jgi:hypothetical protein